jgi:hypothetical protein
MSFDGRQVDGGPILQVLVAFDAFGESEGLAVRGVHFVNAVDELLEILNVLVCRLDEFQEAFGSPPVLAQRVLGFELVSGAFDLCEVCNDVLEVQLDSVAEIETDWINN